MSSGIDLVAELMAISARTAPKARGNDFIEVSMVKGDDVERLAEEMKEYGKEHGEYFIRNGNSLLQSEAVVLIGLKDSKSVGLNCGACGNEACKDLPAPTNRLFKGPHCALRQMDLGIALGSAVKTASMHNVDTRIMYSVGVVARRLGLTESDVVMGIPLAMTGKSVFFDRG